MYSYDNLNYFTNCMVSRVPTWSAAARTVTEEVCVFILLVFKTEF